MHKLSNSVYVSSAVIQSVFATATSQTLGVALTKPVSLSSKLSKLYIFIKGDFYV